MTWPRQLVWLLVLVACDPAPATTLEACRAWSPGLCTWLSRCGEIPSDSDTLAECRSLYVEECCIKDGTCDDLTKYPLEKWRDCSDELRDRDCSVPLETPTFCLVE